MKIPSPPVPSTVGAVDTSSADICKTRETDAKNAGFASGAVIFGIAGAAFGALAMHLSMKKGRM